MSVMFRYNTNCWPDKLVGPRVVLKRLEPTQEYADLFHQIISNNTKHLTDSFAYLVHQINSSQAALSFLTAAYQDFLYEARDDYGIFVGNDFVGAVLVWGKRRTDREIMYWLKEEACGYGYMHDALDLIEQEHAKCAPHHILFANVNAKARASAALLTARGYNLDGLFFFKRPMSNELSRTVIQSAMHSMPKDEGRIYG
ncbi:MAG: GNAT family N-acetyltransferase [Alphaproteobacteria bacterium]|nr:GNAT family N-acetyltransferase [Alphaproteobacteria bacterium]